jgi:hypothetical protein
MTLTHRARASDREGRSPTTADVFLTRRTRRTPAAPHVSAFHVTFKERVMNLSKCLASIIVIYCSAHFAVAPAEAQGAGAGRGCNTSTLIGSYILAAHGMTDAGEYAQHVAYVGMVVYDGKGNVKFVASFADGTETSLVGKYSVARNCKGAVTYENDRTATYFVSPTGDELVYVITSGSVVASSARRVSREQLDLTAIAMR